MWLNSIMTSATALTRVLELLDADPATVDTLDTGRGYLDLLGDEPPEHRTPALAAMRSKALPIIYERWWRPVVRVLNGIGGPDQAGEQAIARDLLGLHSGQTVLDVACGPGNFTRSFAPAVGTDGLVVGFDESATMLAKAVEQTHASQVGYVRGDARTLPFPDGTFDAVGCFLALHLIPEPFRAVREMIRVLAPGGRIAIQAPYLPGGIVPRLVDRAVNAPMGIRVFGRAEFTDAFREAGLVDVRQKITGLFQYVGARRDEG
jgi:SAM-dependent methyltransferase